MGIVGYGDIGQACARLAKAFKMKVVALRRNTQLSEAEKVEGVVVSGVGRVRASAATCQVSPIVRVNVLHDLTRL